VRASVQLAVSDGPRPLDGEWPMDTSNVTSKVPSMVPGLLAPGTVHSFHPSWDGDLACTGLGEGGFLDDKMRQIPPVRGQCLVQVCSVQGWVCSAR